MSKQNTPPTSSQPGATGLDVNGHEVLLVRADAETQATRMNDFRVKHPEKHSALEKQIRPLPTSIDEFLSQYPEARQTRATVTCPACGVEIPVPHGSLRAYVEYLKANDPTAAEGPYRLDMRLGCRTRVKSRL